MKYYLRFVNYPNENLLNEKLADHAGHVPKRLSTFTYQLEPEPNVVSIDYNEIPDKVFECQDKVKFDPLVKLFNTIQYLSDKNRIYNYYVDSHTYLILSTDKKDLLHEGNKWLKPTPEVMVKIFNATPKMKKALENLSSVDQKTIGKYDGQLWFSFRSYARIRFGQEMKHFQLDFGAKDEYKKILKNKPLYVNLRIAQTRLKSGCEKNKVVDFTLLYAGDLTKPVNLRVHHMCETSEILHSQHCDCLFQKEEFLNMAIKKYLLKGEPFLFIYAKEEGRGIGLENKINAYIRTAEFGEDTVEAMMNTVGFNENRLFDAPAEIAYDLGIKEVNLKTNNPAKIYPFLYRGIKTHLVSAWTNDENLSIAAKNYTDIKVKKMHHLEKKTKAK
ncbi:GTP cyclohydrolase II [[Mycoplasma] testudinis]|uniref:hypothetical protein n=1 Tax=[Mycoplasma] testudinis TaxID=33924 RepID=UPI0006991F40|nr:hypothetical protein [[Mycoplasma] testudinis]